MYKLKLYKNVYIYIKGIYNYILYNKYIYNIIYNIAINIYIYIKYKFKIM